MSHIEIEHGCARSVEGRDALMPLPCRVLAVSQETSDVKALRITSLQGTRPFDAKPGQTAMLSIIPSGECMFCVSSQGEDYLEFTVKKVGFVTEQLHALRPGDAVGLRGPYGNWFPYEGLRGKDLLFIGGGIGMAPLRSLITYLFDCRSEYGAIDLVYSGSTPDDLVFCREIQEDWPRIDGVTVHLSVYRESPGWDGEVAFTAPFLERLGYAPDGRIAVLCGGPSLFRTCLASLEKLGFAPEDIITTLEMRMKCGIGKCGRCNIGSHYICLDGPVFSIAELHKIPGALH
ncbi:MAG: FAD/NAD(P)-binding protein [Coriobacteriales bacterium]|jgi:NAD(P)H-flavin reductase|nr:FAD/NAD(P)-binding protein [Coriobacteriales bacterium]